MMIAPQFSPIAALLGGVLIGLSATTLWLGIGRVAGISGILGNLASSRGGDAAWRLAFLAGLIVAAAIYQVVAGPTDYSVSTTRLVVAVGGFLVGFGTRLGGGCTSGHAVCGIARFSRRSLAATAIFTVTAMVTVAFVRHQVGG